MKKISLIFLFFIPLSLFAQIKNAFEVKSQDTLRFEGSIVRFPPFNDLQKSYLIELDDDYVVGLCTFDIVQPNIEVYGWSRNSDGKFHLAFTTNETDQRYFFGACVRYILVRSPKYDETKPSYTVGLDMIMQKCK